MWRWSEPAQVSGLKRPDSSLTETPGSPSGAGIADAWIRRSKQMGSRARAVAVDAADVESVRELFAEAGPITDLVVTVTQRGGAGSIEQLVESDLLGAFAVRPCSPPRPCTCSALARGRRVHHLGDRRLRPIGLAWQRWPGRSEWRARGRRETARCRVGPRRVTAVSPGVIETEWWNEPSPKTRQEALDNFAGRALVARNGQPADVAHAIVALVENGFITGVVLPCDGGLRLA
jgi:Enoyl-(Acyl carrier protein) reductase